MAIPDDLLDSLMKDYKNPEDLIGKSGLLKQLTKQLLERAMQAEINEHLGYAKNLSAKKRPPTLATAAIPSESKENLAISILQSPVTGTLILSRSSFLKGRAVSPALMTKSLPFMPVA